MKASDEIDKIEYETFKRNSLIISDRFRAERDEWQKKYEVCNQSCEKLTDMLGEAQAEIEAKDAQIAGLVGALGIISSTSKPCDCSNKKPFKEWCYSAVATKALSTLPAKQLEIYKAEREVIEKAKNMNEENKTVYVFLLQSPPTVPTYHGMTDSISDLDNPLERGTFAQNANALIDAVERLKALEERK